MNYLCWRVWIGHANICVKSSGLRGNITVATPDNQLGIQSADVVVLSCDAYSGNIQPSQVFQTALDRNPTAILLYSTASGSCALSGTSTSYDQIYTMKNVKDSENMSKGASGTDAEALIGTDQAISSANATDSSASGNGASSGNSTNSWGPSPSTAVAMIM